MPKARQPAAEKGGARKKESPAASHRIRVAGDSGATGRERPTAADTAVIVCHGMGQQVPFETLQLVIHAMQQKAGLEKVDVTVDLIPEDPANPEGGTLPIAMATWEEPGKGHRRADFFECYWAPLIEGKVGLWDVFAFLCGAGFRGIGFALKGPFNRRVFGKMRNFRLGGVRTAIQLAMALGLVLAVACLAPTFLAVAAARILENFGFAIPRGDDLFRLLQAETLLLSRGLLACAFPFLLGAAYDSFASAAKLRSVAKAALLLLPASLYFFLILFESPWKGPFLIGLASSFAAYIACRAASAIFGWNFPLTFLLWFHVFAAWALVFGMGLFCAWSWTHYWNIHDVSAIRSWSGCGEGLPGQGLEGIPWLSRLSDLAACGILRNLGGDEPFHKTFLVLHALAGLGLLWGARFFLIEFAGDVAAYVASHKVDRFYAIREKIQEACLRVAAHVYGTPAAAGWKYRRVLIVGHSLGSVLAYDTLNRMLLRDRFAGGALKVAERTPLLLTFGSPLDKTAYLFRTQLPGKDVREGLAEARQPLIHDYALRPARWINIWSRNDIISGPLDFYDLPKRKKQKGDNGVPKYEPDPNVDPGLKGVENRIDPEARMPLGAHTQYWGNRALAEALAEGLQEA